MQIAGVAQSCPAGNQAEFVFGPHGSANQEKKVISFLLNLSEEAKKYRGKVILLIGNHEIMNILGIFTYSSNKDIKISGGIKERANYFSIPNGEFIKLYAKKAYIICKIGDWIFCHAGILPKISNLYDINIIKTQLRCNALVLMVISQ